MSIQSLPLLLRAFLVFAPFLADFDFFAVFLREVDFAFLRPPDDVVDAEDVLADFFFDPRSDVVALATDLSAFIGVPLRISSPIDSAVLATGLFPRADCSPTMAPATPPAIAPTGPPTIAPSTAPVTPPTACLETEMFFSAGAFDDGRVAFFLDFLAIVLPLVVLNLISGLRKAQVLRRYHNRCNSRRTVASEGSKLASTITRLNVIQVKNRPIVRTPSKFRGLGLRVVYATNAVELAEVQCENLHGIPPLCLAGENYSQLDALRRTALR